MTDSPYNNFPASLGNITFGAGVRVGEYGTGSCYDNLTNQPRDLHVWSSASLGSELHTGPNAASDPSGSEANSTAGWTVYTGTLTSDNTAPLDVGSYYLKLNHATSMTNVSYNFGATIHGGRLYKLTFDHKATASHTIKMCNMGSGNVSFQETLSADANWTAHTIYFVAVTDTASDHLLFIYGPAGQTVRIDNLSLREVMGGDIVARGLITGGGTSGIKVQSDGTVGIGTTSPESRLHIADTHTTAGHYDSMFVHLDGSSQNDASDQVVAGKFNNEIIKTTDDGATAVGVWAQAAYKNSHQAAIGLVGVAGNWGYGGPGDNTAIGVLAAGEDFDFYAGSSSPSYFNGSVGIGTRTPQKKLHVQHDDSAGGIVIDRLSTANRRSQISFRASPQAQPDKWAVGVDLSQNNGQNFFIHDYTPNYPNGQTRLFIDSAGKVGIGTANPQKTLDVNGEIASANNLKVYDSGWFSVNPTLQYTYSKDHGLGGDPRGMIVYFSAVSSPGPSDIISAAGPAARHDFAGSDYGAFAWLPNRTQLIVRAGDQVGWSSTWRTSGYYRVVAWR